MAWIRETCEDVICGGGLGILKRVFGISLFTDTEVEEITSLKKLTLSIMEKSSQIVTEPIIRQGQKAGLETFKNNASPEMIAAGVVTAAELVCNKSFKTRFTEILMGSCLNLVGC